MDESRQAIIAKALEIKRELKAATVIPCARFTLSTEECGIFDSKIGGLPYFPEGAPVPCDRDGHALYLLAQINCEDIAELPDFPHKGMLQFFISDDDLYGSTLTVPSPQDDWRVVYYPEIDPATDPALAEEVFSKGLERELCPFEGEYRMNFTLDEEGISVWDCRFEALFIGRWNEAYPDEEPIDSLYDLDDDVYECIWDETDRDEVEDFGDDDRKTMPLMHKMGGYPFFTQEDPRDGETCGDYDTLLFQLDSQGSGGVDVMWGDLGIGNFFISREKLKALDFSDVLYNWDCY